MYSLLYDAAMRVYQLVIWIAARTNPKAAMWIGGRKNLLENLRRKIHVNEKYIWVHCASAGEFEQARPVIEAIRSRHERYKILVTFFSPSGYELRKNYADAHYVTYLPMDIGSNACEFVKLVSPVMAIFVKYELWQGYLQALANRDIPLFLISAHFTKDHVFFKWYGAPFRKTLNLVSTIFVQSESSCRLLSTIKINHCVVAGDTRFDRVISIADNKVRVEKIETFLAKKQKVLVAGSTWPEDENVLFEWLRQAPDWSLIIVPHEISNAHIESITGTFNAARFSVLANGDTDARILIVDSVGLLSRIYRYATVSYVGGGFGKGIHNTLEAAVYGKPVLFGPHFQRFQEATELIECGGAFSISDVKQLKDIIARFEEEPEWLAESGRAAANFVRSKAGATSRIMKYIDGIIHKAEVS